VQYLPKLWHQEQQNRNIYLVGYLATFFQLVMIAASMALVMKEVNNEFMKY